MSVTEKTSSGSSPLLGGQDVRSVLVDAIGSDGVSRVLFGGRQHDRFTLIVAPTTGPAALTLKAVADRIEESVRGPSACNWDGILEHDGRTYLAVLLAPLSAGPDAFEDGTSWNGSARRHSFSSLGSLPLPSWKQQRKRRTASLTRHAFNILFGILLVSLAAVGSFLLFGGRFDGGSGRSSTSSSSGSVDSPAAAIPPSPSASSSSAGADQTLRQYSVGSSQGPLYSALLTPDNVTAWVQSHYDPAKFYVRIDEQALIPIELLDEQEARYQDYLARRYVEKAELRDSRAFLDPDFFHDPNNFMLPSDMEFHRGHCIRTFRRYWQAKETGKHVAPWDIDYRHLHHCFSMLEKVMMPEGPRVVSDPPVSMSWRTKIVTWEP